jgi:aminoglycoside phosphotransferase (APT) family kinase protein
MFEITPNLARKLIAQQFPEFSHFDIQPVKLQGHDNRTFRLGNDMQIRMPTAESYALKVSKEQNLLPKLNPHLSIAIPEPIKMGTPSNDYPFHFSIYKWLNGESANSLELTDSQLEGLAFDLANFLNELQSIDTSEGLEPGLHNYWRGDHIGVYDIQARIQIAQLDAVIDSKKVLALWEAAMTTQWNQPPVWIHGDIASGNILIQGGILSAVIDFVGMAIGDPACDLVIAWTLFKNKSKVIFQNNMNLDDNTWLRAKAWALWKATFELCQMKDLSAEKTLIQKGIIQKILNDSRN